MDRFEEVDKARRLLRQGQTHAALDVLEDVCARWDDLVDVGDLPKDEDSLELAFHPRKDDVPPFYVEEGVLSIENRGWEIDEVLLSHLADNAARNFQMGMPDIDLRRYIEKVFRSAVDTGKIRRKGNGEAV